MLVAALACTPASLARGGAGHNPATKKLEDAFKIALYVRSVSNDGCYPSPPRLATNIARRSAGSRPASHGTRTGCTAQCRLRPEARHHLQHGDAWPCAPRSGLYVLNSAQGTIRVQGRPWPEDRPGRDPVRLAA